MKFLLLVVVIANVCNANDEPDVPLVNSIADDLLYDENGKLATNYVLFPFDNEENCGPEQLETEIYGFEARPVADEALEAFFPDRSACEAVCVERGTDRSLVHAVMPYRRWQKSTSNPDFLNWFESNCRQVEACFLQYHSRESPVTIFKVERDSDDEEVWEEYFQLSYGEQKTQCFRTRIGDEFVAVEGNDTTASENVVIEKISIEYITTRAIGSLPPNNPPEFDVDAAVDEALLEEWEKHNIVKRTFSELGFKKGRLPDDIFASMGSFYYNNHQNKVLEEWGSRSLDVNWWESDVYFIQIPWEIKWLWQKNLLEMVQAWAGVPIEQTDMYGVRQYESGSRLYTHVDREETHAVSLIVNIDQGNLSEPWPIEVNDHAERLHEVIMQPGDVVYYESAKALHGRNRPLQGEGAYYVNLFTHYRPIGDPKWYEKTNPPGVPEPLLEMEGECRLETVGITPAPTEETTPGESLQQLGLIQAVRCDDPRLGPYLSPTLFQATGGQDLIQWVHMTSPPASHSVLLSQS